MTKAKALAAARELKTSLLDHGVRAVSIELQQGAGNSGWYTGTHRRKLSHHIVSRRSQGLTPGLSLVKNGRTGPNPLSGPLSNGYGGFDLVYRIITMALANHPGEGGPRVYDGLLIPKNNGRPYLWGTEYEGGWHAADWTDEFHTFMSRSNAGVLDWLGTNEQGHDEHSGWAPDRKVDRLGYTTASGRLAIARHWYDKNLEDDVALSDDDKQWIRELLQDTRDEIEKDIPRGVLVALTGNPNAEYDPSEAKPFSVNPLTGKVDEILALLKEKK